MSRPAEKDIGSAIAVGSLATLCAVGFFHAGRVTKSDGAGDIASSHSMCLETEGALRNDMQRILRQNEELGAELVEAMELTEKYRKELDSCMKSKAPLTSNTRQETPEGEWDIDADLKYCAALQAKQLEKLIDEIRAIKDTSENRP